ncbi:MAG: hypothetical protein AB3N18_01500 [Allomuricauda sp.]
MMQSKFSIPHKSPYADISIVKYRAFVYQQGFYFCNLGTVMIHCQELDEGFWALFCFYHDNRYHYLSTESGSKFSKRRLAVLAGKFARAIFHSENSKNRSCYI